jgi:uncharacterized membrane protein
MDTALPVALASPALRTEPSAAERTSRALAVGSAAALLALCLGWELVATGSWAWALKALPLLPALPGLWRYRMYTYRWVSLLVWVYTTEGLVHATSSTGLQQVLGGVEVALSIALFVAVTLHIRQRLAAAKAANTSATTATP